MSLPPQFQAWANFRCWINYVLLDDPDQPGKKKKIPVDVRTGCACNPHELAHQYSYGEAVATGRPVGFVIDKANGFWFLDVDNCRDPVTGHLSLLAQELYARLAGCAVEVSQSGTGLHFFGWGPVPEHSCRNILLGLELYTDRRFVALTFKGI